MKSESVTKAWEFYRDNCQGFNEPMRKEFRKLDEYVASIESENAELRELVKSMYYDLTHQTFPPDWVTEYADDMRELGVEV